MSTTGPTPATTLSRTGKKQLASALPSTMIWNEAGLPARSHIQMLSPGLNGYLKWKHPVPRSLRTGPNWMFRFQLDSCFVTQPPTPDPVYNWDTVGAPFCLVMALIQRALDSCLMTPVVLTPTPRPTTHLQLPQTSQDLTLPTSLDQLILTTPKLAV